MTVLVAVGSFKGAPGATTVALGLAGCWPGGGGVLVEADPHGADLGARFGHATPPGLASAAAAARNDTTTTAGWLTPHLQRLGIGVEVLLGAGTAEAAQVAVASLAGRAGVLRRHGAPVVVLDVGRINPAAVSVPVVVAADLLLIVTRPELADLRHVAGGLALLPPPVRQRVGLVLVGPGTYLAREITRDLGVPVAAHLPHDRWGAAVLAGRTVAGRGWRRLRAPRALSELATHLAAGPRPSGADTGRAVGRAAPPPARSHRPDQPGTAVAS